MNRNRIIKYILVVLGVISMLMLFGCGKKYKLNLPSGFESKKTSYAAGEEVKVTFNFIATDTDYSFFSDADDVKKGYSDSEGYVFTFVMPERDVTFWEESRNSMEYRPPVEYTERDLIDNIDPDRMVFDYYEATVATVGGDGYTEDVLYRWAESDLLLAKYTKSEGTNEKTQVCRVPLMYLYECLKTVNLNGMKDWKDGMGLEGKVYAVRFKDKDSFIRISSDDMPEDGRKAFTEIENVLRGTWNTYRPLIDEGSIGIIDDPVTEEVDK